MKAGAAAPDRTQSGNATTASSVLTVIAIVLFVTALLLHNTLYGEAIREEAARLEAQAIGIETKEFCERLSISDGSERFALCSEVLSEVRRNEATRRAHAAAGIL